MSEIKASVTDSAPHRGQRLVLLGLVMASTLALDLWSKNWAWHNLRHKRPMVIVDPLLDFAFSFNLGSAFGFLNSVSWARFFFIGVTILALVYMGWLAKTLPTRPRYSFVAIGLISAGATGNLHDRLVRANEGGFYGVVDFIKINYPWGGSWPTFNVADVLLLAGVGLLFIYLRKENLDDLETVVEPQTEAEPKPEDPPRPSPES